MTGAIDTLSGHFTPENIDKNFLSNQEELSRFEQVGRAKSLKGYSPAEFVSRMDAANVDKLLIAAILTYSYRGHHPVEHTTPEEVIAVSELFPKMFFGLYGINPWDGMAGVRELERLVKDHGFKGIHLHPHGFGFPPDHAYYFPFYAKCQELDVTAVISMGHTIDLMPIESGRPYHLDKVALYFPELRIVCAHTGWPWVEEAIALAWKHPNVFLGTSAYAPKHWSSELTKFVNSHGQDKVLWGTDYPLINHVESLNQIKSLGLKPTSEQKLLRENALRVFNFTE